MLSERPWVNVERLTAEDEQALAARVHGDDPDDAAAARNALVAANVALVYGLSRRYARRWRRSIEDMDQDGMVGLVRAAELYEPGRVRFSTFAYPHIRYGIQGGIERDHTIQVSRSAWELLCGYDTRYQDLPGRDAILAAARRAVACRGMGSRRDGAADDKGYTMSPLDTVPARPGTPPDEMDRFDALRDAMQHLTDRERHILGGRFERGLTLAQIGDELGLTKERVRQIEAHALGQLRIYLGRVPEPPGSPRATRGGARAAAVERARATVQRAMAGNP